GYNAIIASDGHEATILAGYYSPVFVILDLMLPDIDGIDLCKRLRSIADMPILILTAKGEEQDKILAFSVGADDYMVKPFSARELVARVKTILKRYIHIRPKSQKILSFDGIDLDLEMKSVRIGKECIHLTLSEFRILRTLMDAPGRVFSRMELVEKIYPQEDVNVTDRTIDVHIRKLREKIEQNPARPKFIISLRGKGYKFHD
ncbi:MAG TPA: response regulator transcription factor, partial [Nitrospiria bacterium]|nr:response regulator transcription factor [Nitrospiria bacterium]